MKRQPQVGSRLRNPVAMEALEPRQLLSNTPILIGDTPDANARSLLYNDSDGTIVRVTFTHGCAEVSFDQDDVVWNLAGKKAVVEDQADIATIKLVQSSLKSTLKFKTSMPSEDDSDADEYAWVDCIVGANLGLGQLQAGKVDIGGGIDIDQGAKVCKIGDVGEAVLDFGDGEKMTFSAGTLDGTDLKFTGTIASIKVDEWSYGQITAGAVGNVKSVGYFGASIESDSSIGKITCRQLEGDLTAHAGSIGNIFVKGVAVADSQEEEWDFDGGDILSETIYASDSIGNITLLGGSIGVDDTCNITAENGDIGNITTKVGKFRTPQGDYWLFPEKYWGWDIHYTQADIGDVVANAGGKIGKISVSGGDCGGTFHAEDKIGGVSVRKSVDVPDRVFMGGDFTSTLEAAEIGNVRVKAGYVEAALRAGNRLGNVIVEAQTLRVKSQTVIEGYDVDSYSRRIVLDNTAMQLNIQLGESSWHGWNHMGTIKLVGVSMTLTGNLYDLLGEPHIVPKPITDAMIYSDDEEEFVYEQQVGGPDNLTNNLSLLENQIP